MDEDDVTNPAEGEEPEDQEVTDEPDLEVDDQDEGDDDEQEAEPDLEDVEYEGKTYKLNKELKEALLRQSDYTRKTQAHAEEKRAFEDGRKAFQEQVQFQQQFLREHAQIVSLDDQIEQYGKINWQQLSDPVAGDPVKAQQLWIQYQQLRDRRGALVQTVQQKAQTLAEQRKDESAKQIEEGQAVLRKEIPNYGPELVSKLRDFGVSQVGLKPEEIDRVTDPRHVKLLNLAYIGHQLAEKQRKAMTKKPAEANPVPTVQSKGKPDNRLRDDLSIEEWNRRRTAQLAARR
jgi:hypothetical protein